LSTALPLCLCIIFLIMKSMLALALLAVVGSVSAQSAAFESKPTIMMSESVAEYSENPSLPSFTSVNAPIVKPEISRAMIELSPIVSTYNVPSQSFSTENIKQPITQPVVQPYLQRYVQQAQPIVQPVVARVVQPVIHRQLQPVFRSMIEQGPAAYTITQPIKYTTVTNQPIVGSDLLSLSMSEKPVAGQFFESGKLMDEDSSKFESSPSSSSWSSPSSSSQFSNEKLPGGGGSFGSSFGGYGQEASQFSGAEAE